MRLDAKHDAEMAKRKGFARRTILAVIWLGLCFAAAYYFANWLFENEILTLTSLYSRLFIPRTVPQWVVVGGFIFVIVVVLQLLVIILYAFVSPVGRYRPGTPTAESRDPEPDDRKFDYRR